MYGHTEVNLYKFIFKTIMLSDYHNCLPMITHAVILGRFAAFPSVNHFVTHNDAYMDATRMPPLSCVPIWMNDENVPTIATYPHREVQPCTTPENVRNVETVDTNEDEQSVKEVHEQTEHRRVYHARDEGNSMGVEIVQTYGDHGAVEDNAHCDEAVRMEVPVAEDFLDKAGQNHDGVLCDLDENVEDDVQHS